MAGVEEMEVNVKTLDLQVFTFHQVDKNMLVSEFKEKIANEVGVPVGQQRLIFGGRVLNDYRTLSDYHVENGHTLHLVTRQPTESQAPPGTTHGEASSSNGQNPNANGAVLGLPAVQVPQGNQTQGRPSDTVTQFLPQFLLAQTVQDPLPINPVSYLRTLSEFMSNIEQDLRINLPDSLENESQTNGGDQPAINLPTNPDEVQTIEALSSLLDRVQRLLRDRIIVALSQVSNLLEQQRGSNDIGVRYQLESETMVVASVITRLSSVMLELSNTLLTLDFRHFPAEADADTRHEVYPDSHVAHPIMVQRSPPNIGNLGSAGTGVSPRQVNIIHIHTGTGPRAARNVDVARNARNVTSGGAINAVPISVDLVSLIESEIISRLRNLNMRAGRVPSHGRAVSSAVQAVTHGTNDVAGVVEQTMPIVPASQQLSSSVSPDPGSQSSVRSSSRDERMNFQPLFQRIINQNPPGGILGSLLDIVDQLVDEEELVTALLAVRELNVEESFQGAEGPSDEP